MHHSPHLKKVFQDQLKNKEQLRFPFGMHEPEVVDLLIQWFYSAQLEIPNEVSNGEDIVRNHIKLWVLANYLDIPDLENQCIYVMEQVHQHTGIAYTSSLEWLWANTKPGALRSYWVDKCCSTKSGSFAREAENLPKEMLIEILDTIADRKDVRDVLLTYNPTAYMEKYYV